MRWHYIERNEWPEETDTLCLCAYCDKPYPFNLTKYTVAMYTDFKGKKEFISNPYTCKGRCIKIQCWIAIDDINEAIYFDELYAEQNNRLQEGE
jgi:hypothetical protein